MPMHSFSSPMETLEQAVQGRPVSMQCSLKVQTFCKETVEIRGISLMLGPELDLK